MRIKSYFGFSGLRGTVPAQGFGYGIEVLTGMIPKRTGRCRYLSHDSSCPRDDADILS